MGLRDVAILRQLSRFPFPMKPFLTDFFLKKTIKYQQMTEIPEMLMGIKNQNKKRLNMSGGYINVCTFLALLS